jgi:hypothetical protein
VLETIHIDSARVAAMLRHLGIRDTERAMAWGFSQKLSYEAKSLARR